MSARARQQLSGEALAQQEKSLTKLTGIVNSVDALVDVLNTHTSEALLIRGGVPMDSMLEPTAATRQAVFRLKASMRSISQAVEAAKLTGVMLPKGPPKPQVVASETLVESVSGAPRLAVDSSNWLQPLMDTDTPSAISSPSPKELVVSPSRSMKSSARTSVVQRPKQKEVDRFMFYPSWTSKLTWDLFVMLIVVMDAMVLPFQLSFKHGAPTDAFDETWFWITLICFTADLLATFNTALQSEEPDGTGEYPLNTDRKDIARIYLRSWFWIDAISTFPWSRLAELFSSGGKGGALTILTKLLKMLKFARIIRLMKMLRARKIKDIWERVEVAIGSIVIVQALMLLRILLIVVAICHWFACIFWIVGSPSSLVTELLPESAQASFEEVPHWTTIKRTLGPGLEEWTFQEMPLVTKYMFCFYWTLGVMRTMPAEVTPVNLTERFFVLMFMFFALSAFAVSVASLTQAYFKINERQRSFGDEMFFVRMHLSKLKVAEPHQRRIKDYLNHLYERRRILAKEANLLDRLPTKLKKEVHNSKMMVQLNKLEALNDLSKRTIREICASSEMFDLMPDERICVAGEVSVATWMICRGHVSAHDLDGELVLPEEPLEIVDEEALLTHEIVFSELTVTTIVCCEVVKIDKESFQRIVSAEATWALSRRKSTFGAQRVSICNRGGKKKAKRNDNQDDESGSAAVAALCCS